MPTPRPAPSKSEKHDHEYENEKLPIPLSILIPNHKTCYAPLHPSRLNPTAPPHPLSITVVNTRRKLYKTRCKRSDVGLGQRLLRRKAAVAYRSEIDQRPEEREGPNWRAAIGSTNIAGNGDNNNNTWLNRFASRQTQGGRGSTNRFAGLGYRDNGNSGGNTGSGNRFAALGDKGNTIRGNRFAPGAVSGGRFAPGAGWNGRQQSWTTRRGQSQGVIVSQRGRHQHQQRVYPSTEKDAEAEEKVPDGTTAYEHRNDNDARRTGSPRHNRAFHTVDISRVQSQLLMTTEPGIAVAFPIRQKPDIASVRLAVVLIALVCIVGLVQCALRTLWWVSDVLE
ncbi:hypothetical protein B0T14DRAFT_563593 [Immersiella caudata]|uniref:Uncharacterized protein n=1 Tax=Immersiella caudata TaxID=314043 RepID=A0AA39X5S3_9PEZI|nr:hypothetical protein B0T14DRAFT_563593 [Immersiella caudata]